MSATSSSEFDLCEELVKAMHQLDFQQKSIDKITSDHFYQASLNQANIVQKTNLIVVLTNTLMAGPWVVPSEIRIALNISTDILSWFDDVKLYVLPFIKKNEESFFPS